LEICGWRKRVIQRYFGGMRRDYSVAPRYRIAVPASTLAYPSVPIFVVLYANKA